LSKDKDDVNSQEAFSLGASPKRKKIKYWQNQRYPYKYYPKGGFGGCPGGV
jgi:hypothetical protein